MVINRSAVGGQSQAGLGKPNCFLLASCQVVLAQRGMKFTVQLNPPVKIPEVYCSYCVLHFKHMTTSARITNITQMTYLLLKNRPNECT